MFEGLAISGGEIINKKALFVWDIHFSLTLCGTNLLRNLRTRRGPKKTYQDGVLYQPILNP